MKYIMLIVPLLLLNGGPAYAEWINMGESDDETMTVYVDLDTVRRKEDLVKMWSMYDYKTEGTYRGKSFLSIKAQLQHDCVDERSQALAEIAYSGNMGSGEIAYSNPDGGKWSPSLPGSLGEALWKIACGEKSSQLYPVKGETDKK